MEHAADVSVVREIQLPIKEVVDVCVLQFQEETVEVTTASPQKRMSKDVSLLQLKGEIGKKVQFQPEVVKMYHRSPPWTCPFTRFRMSQCSRQRLRMTS